MPRPGSYRDNPGIPEIDSRRRPPAVFKLNGEKVTTEAQLRALRKRGPFNYQIGDNPIGTCRDDRTFGHLLEMFKQKVIFTVRPTI